MDSMMPRLQILALLMCVVLAVGAGGDALGGSITVQWDPVSDQNLAGYRIYYGLSSGTYSQSLDLGVITQHTLAGLPDCTAHYIALKSIDSLGQVSSQFSSEISGFTRPTLVSVTPSVVVAGGTAIITLDGVSFEPGATLSFSRPGLTVTALTVESCTQVAATIAISPTMGPGSVDLTLRNPLNVPATLVNGLAVAVDASPPDVTNLRRTDLTPGP